MTFPPPSPDDLLRYLAGTLPSEAEEQVRQYLEATPSLRGVDAALRQVLQTDLLTHGMPNVETRLARLLERIDDIGVTDHVRPAAPDLAQIPRKSKRFVPSDGGAWITRGRAFWMVTTASAIVALMIAVTHGVSPVSKTSRFTTAPGQRATVTLADGSRAMLGPSSDIEVTTGGAGTGTTVIVRGEAMFSVTHRASAPFTVRAGDAVTRVLGTTFLVRRYPTDRTTRVVVTEGRVSVRSESATHAPSMVVAARGLATIDDSGHVDVTPNVAVDEYAAWVSGRLVFRNTAARDVAAELGRAYGVTIRVVDTTLADHKLTWTVPTTHASLADVLDELCGILDSHVVRMDSVVAIAPGRTARRPDTRKQPLTLEPQYGR